jgi:hypothetical protein
MDWRGRFIDMLRGDRAQHLEQIEFLSSGKVMLHVTEAGIRRDVTSERLEVAKRHLDEVEQLLREEGALDA